MKDQDFQKLAQRIVDSFHIFDEEWKEILIEEYVDLLVSQHKGKQLDLPLFYSFSSP